MPSILVLVFILQLVIHLINTFGAVTINNILWRIYNQLPTPASKTVAGQRQLKKQLLKLKQELDATSSQNEFAKWAKLKRQHDKMLEQYEKSKSSLESTQKTFDSTISALRWLGTNGLRMLLQFWFQKQPMYWIPKGWVPYYAEWLLSFPRAPLGSVSIQVWSVACLAMITLVSDALVAAVALAVGINAQGDEIQAKEKGNGEPMTMSASTEKVKEL
ncbi:protein get1 [Calycina marina]|uniref:Protein get1 n=1 Tax=Calycina marina TaxID=1763456 RepID=A0A9P8CG44_9HELO|nr:protein get1 [Calycina marina]